VFASVLIANRGEVACRVIATLRRLGIRSIAVYTAADTGARHVGLADLAMRVDSYLEIDDMVAAAVSSGAEAVHPGYGFLSENHAFAARCEQEGIVFVGPSSEAIRVMGDKISAKAAVSSRGVPIVPGVGEAGMDDETLASRARGLGFPVLIKPSAGGGGKGMHVVESPEGLAPALAAARREAAASFGDDTLFIERYLSSPRHIEVQVLADSFGSVLHLGERDCTLQRRHQKVIEEAPSAIVTPEIRERLGRAACETARSVSYRGAGTVEFIVSNDSPDEFFFMEMNTRLQVEHAVTEAITGLDLVEWQLRIAAGEPLGFVQSDVELTGHAIEARVYAEDPMAGFLPSGGRVQVLREPSGAGVRVDSALVEGLRVSSAYDPMLAKVIAWAPDRTQAITSLRRALEQMTVLGVTTNIEFLHALLGLPEVAAATMDTDLIAREVGRLPFAAPDPGVFAHAALLVYASEWASAGHSLWATPAGWRLDGEAPSIYRLALDGRGSDDGMTRVVKITGTPTRARVTVDGGEPFTASIAFGANTAFIEVAGHGRTVAALVNSPVVEFSDGAVTWRLREVAPPRRRSEEAASAPTITSPMPGSVVSVLVTAGELVEADQPILVVEAMKMEHVLIAPSAGVIRLDAAVGDHVERGQVLAVIDGGAG
jgi:acetyl-CoA/propionyl-CoA carboxylase biotin carboxyl carrier protein